MSKNLFVDMDFREFTQFRKMLSEIGGMQQKYVTQAARAGQRVALKAVKAAAPVGKTGNLRRNIVSVGERSRIKGKKVYDTTYRGGDEANTQLQRTIKHPGAAGGLNQKAYYPASVEYGFLTRANEGRGFQYVAARITGIGLKRVEGSHFMQRAAEMVKPQVEKVMIDTLTKRLEREWRK